MPEAPGRHRLAEIARAESKKTPESLDLTLG
jgi:hypothetical protein